MTRGETILTTELGGWVAQMTDALAQLQDEQAEAGARVERDARRRPSRRGVTLRAADEAHGLAAAVAHAEDLQEFSAGTVPVQL